MAIIDTLNTLIHNPVFSGMIGGGMVASLLYSLRAVPAKIATFIRRWFTVNLTIKGTQSFYPLLNQWIVDQNLSDHATQLQLTSDTYERGKGSGTDFTLGFGDHFIWVKRRPVWVNRVRSDKSITGGYVSSAFLDETVTLTTIGRSHRIIRHIVDSAKSLSQSVDDIRVQFFNEGSYDYGVRRIKRPLSSIFIPESQKQRIVHDIERFYANRDRYTKRGTPWRRGFLLRGLPGTGKTSLIFALASHFEKNVKMINLANVGGDNNLMTAINEAGDNCFIVIEDVDSVGVTHNRETVHDTTELKDEQDKGTLTLAGILNAIDGISSPEGRVLFFTSNHAELLDPALIRPGRVDMDETIEPIDHDLAMDMVRAFHPDNSEMIFEQHVRHHLPIPAANLQNILIQLD